MAISYKKLWKMLIDKEMNKNDLHNLTGISKSTITKMSNEQYISLEVLERICSILNCNINDVIEFKERDEK